MKYQKPILPGESPLPFPSDEDTLFSHLMTHSYFDRRCPYCRSELLAEVYNNLFFIFKEMGIEDRFDRPGC